MITSAEIPLITVAVLHRKSNHVPTQEKVDFKICWEGKWIKAIPLMSKQERLTTGLPKELRFQYFDYRITTAVVMEEESLHAIKQIILEMLEQEFL